MDQRLDCTRLAVDTTFAVASGLRWRRRACDRQKNAPTLGAFFDYSFFTNRPFLIGHIRVKRQKASVRVYKPYAHIKSVVSGRFDSR